MGTPHAHIYPHQPPIQGVSGDSTQLPHPAGVDPLTAPSTMPILLFLIDTSASMSQRTHLGTTYLDIAKGAVETFMKVKKGIKSNGSFVFNY